MGRSDRRSNPREERGGHVSVGIGEFWVNGLCCCSCCSVAVTLGLASFLLFCPIACLRLLDLLLLRRYRRSSADVVQLKHRKICPLTDPVPLSSISPEFRWIRHCGLAKRRQKAKRRDFPSIRIGPIGPGWW